MCIFSLHSIVRDPPFSRIDLISCRNLLIYLDARLQNHVVPLFHHAPRPGGCLFLGNAKNVAQHEDAFVALDMRLKVFQRVDAVGRQAQMPTLLRGPRSLAWGGWGHREAPPAGTPLRRVVDARVLERFAPVHVLVNREGDVVHELAIKLDQLNRPTATSPTCSTARRSRRCSSTAT